jgi:hypothetical protein
MTGFWMLPNRRGLTSRWGAAWIVLAACGAGFAADEVVMRNGDRYYGQVLSLNSNTVVLQSEVLGQVRLSRSQVGGITLKAPKPAGEPTPAVPAISTLPSGGTTTNDLEKLVLQLGRSTNVVADVQRGLLSEAGPEATRQFNDMVKGLLTGRLTVDDIRAQAATAAGQIRQIRSELGEEAGGVLDGYLKILEDFVNRASARTAKPAAPLAK